MVLFQGASLLIGVSFSAAKKTPRVSCLLSPLLSLTQKGEIRLMGVAIPPTNSNIPFSWTLRNLPLGCTSMDGEEAPHGFPGRSFRCKSVHQTGAPARSPAGKVYERRTPAGSLLQKSRPVIGGGTREIMPPFHIRGMLDRKFLFHFLEMISLPGIRSFQENGKCQSENSQRREHHHARRIVPRRIP